MSAAGVRSRPSCREHRQDSPHVTVWGLRAWLAVARAVYAQERARSPQERWRLAALAGEVTPQPGLRQSPADPGDGPAPRPAGRR